MKQQKKRRRESILSVAIFRNTPTSQYDDVCNKMFKNAEIRPTENKSIRFEQKCCARTQPKQNFVQVVQRTRTELFNLNIETESKLH